MAAENDADTVTVAVKVSNSYLLYISLYQEQKAIILLQSSVFMPLKRIVIFW